VTSIDTAAPVVGRGSAALRAAPATLRIGVAALGASHDRSGTKPNSSTLEQFAGMIPVHGG
jgi:hypothetical protein